MRENGEKRDDLLCYSEALRTESQSLINENRELRAKSRQLRDYSNSILGQVKKFLPRFQSLNDSEF